MILLQRFFTKCAFIASCLFAIGCHAEMSDSKYLSVKTYFASFSGYSIPLNLVDKISEDEAASRGSYYVATYDEKGVLIIVEKYFQGSLFFRHEYSYRDNGVLKESRVVNADGKEKVNLFDEKGKIIKED